MSLDTIPIWALFGAVILLVMLSIEAGYQIGLVAHGRAREKESPVSTVAGSILALVAFMLAFTFGIVSDRYYARVALVRDEANAVRTAFHRVDFLPESDRAEARRLLGEYLDLRLAFVQSARIEQKRLDEFLSRAAHIQNRLWDVAVANARRDMNSEIGSLYVQSLNEIIESHAHRIAVGVQARIPVQIWIVLAGLTVLGMVAIGYQLGIAGSTRSPATLILAISFAMVIAMIAALDRPGGFARISQQPLIDLRNSMIAAASKD